MNETKRYTIDREGSQWLGLREAAQLLGFSSHRNMYVALNRGHLNGLRGRKLAGQTSPWIFHIDDIEDFLDSTTLPIGEHHQAAD